MNFDELPPSAEDPRYLKRIRAVSSLLRSKQDRLVEDGMLMDRFTAEEDFYWFLLRFTSYADPELRHPGSRLKGFRITDRHHALRGKLWIEHPFVFWYARELQRILAEPPDGPTWVCMHRIAYKTTLLLLFALWLLARDEMETEALWTHKVDTIGANMGRGVLDLVQSDAIGDHWPQFRNLREGRNLGFLVDRPPGPRDQSLSVFSILGSIESIHPNWFFLDDVVTQQLRGNVEQIAKISGRISAIAAAMPPDAQMVCANTPWDESDPLMARAADGWFGRIIEQWATEGGRILERVNGEMREDRPAFTRRGEANLHTKEYFEGQRRKINDDSVYFPQFEGKFFKSPTVLFDWEKIRLYEETPEALAAASPFINIIVDGAGGGQGADFTCIRVMTWTANDAWANLDLLRERVGQTVAMQLLCGWDDTDPRTQWMTDFYKRKPDGVPRYQKMGVVEYWMAFDPKLTVWFDDNTSAGWREAFAEHLRLRRMNFGGRIPEVRKWPEVHILSGGGEGKRRKSYTKEWHIRNLESFYGRGAVAYPRDGFGHGSRFGLTGSQDDRDTMLQFKNDEFSRMELGKLPPFDDGLDTERLMTMDRATVNMKRPAAGGGYSFGDRQYPAISIANPWGLPQPWYKEKVNPQAWMGW